jgi:2-methylaconitate cis-trans-isomerase PrpF
MKSRKVIVSALKSRGYSTTSYPWPGGSVHTQSSLKAAYYRGGTSRALILRETDLPKSQIARDSLFLQAIGAPDPHGRQLNGLGAGVSSLSKICIVGIPDGKAGDKEGLYDVTYTFVGIGIEEMEVDYAGNCGNMSSAIGPFAYNERMLPIPPSVPDFYESYTGKVTVRILNTNTNKLLHAHFQVQNGQARVDAETPIDGVSGLGTGVDLEFLHPSGSKTSGLLPTGKPSQILLPEDPVEVSCVDAANPCVFVRASDVDLEATILPADLMANPSALARLERLRAAAAKEMGLLQADGKPPRVVPKLALVSPPTTQKTLSGAITPADDVDITIRFLSDGQAHRAIPLTGALCTAGAARVAGSVVHKALKDGKQKQMKAREGMGEVRIGHPSGRVILGSRMETGELASVSVVRNTRRIFEGQVFWNDDVGKDDGVD